jgi:hypothetical protein
MHLRLIHATHLQAMQQLRQQLWEAQQQALATSTQLSQLRATSGIARTKLEGALAAAKDELRLKQQALAALQQEKAAALRGWQEEAEARLAAEQSERRALDKAAEQVCNTTMHPPATPALCVYWCIASSAQHLMY